MLSAQEIYQDNIKIARKRKAKMTRAKFRIITPLYKEAYIIVYTETGFERNDAITAAQAVCGKIAKVEREFKTLRSIPAGAIPVKNCEGWAWLEIVKIR